MVFGYRRWERIGVEFGGEMAFLMWEKDHTDAMTENR